MGVPIPAVNADYFEVFDLSDLDHTLRVLGITLFVVGIITTLLGTGLGRFASTRLLRPLADVSRAAGAIAGGELDTRLDPDAADPDLEGLTNSFNTMVDQLQVRIEREARFNSDVSHELRSPLTTLAASLEVLEAEQDHLPPRSQRALQLLGDDLRRFQRMVSDLLEMSRVDAGSSDVFLEEVDVSELVQRSVEAGARSLDGHARSVPSVRIDPAVRGRHVGVDKRRFERVMVNLMENAAHYGGGAREIAVEPRATSGSWSRSTTPARASTRPSAPRSSNASTGAPPRDAGAPGRAAASGWPWWPSTCASWDGGVRVETSPQGGARLVLEPARDRRRRRRGRRRG